MAASLVDESPAHPVPAGATLDFDPRRDGFAFTNHFVWTDADLAALSRSLKPWASGLLGVAGLAAGALRGRRAAVGGSLLGATVAAGGGGDALVKAIARRWSSFGLCGGMALAAIERWPGGDRVPTSALRRDHLRPLLRRRQEATLRASLGRFARLWARARVAGRSGADGPFARDLRAELDRLGARIRSGRPALVGLVGDAPDPFALHQVVVFGIDRTGPLAASLSVYDPNAPGRTHTITTAPAPGGRTRLTTTMATGPRDGGGVHVSTRPGHLAHLFEIDVPGMHGGPAWAADEPA